jgi:hypothetical protein
MDSYSPQSATQIFSQKKLRRLYGLYIFKITMLIVIHGFIFVTSSVGIAMYEKNIEAAREIRDVYSIEDVSRKDIPPSIYDRIKEQVDKAYLGKWVVFALVVLNIARHVFVLTSLRIPAQRVIMWVCFLILLPAQTALLLRGPLSVNVNATTIHSFELAVVVLSALMFTNEWFRGFI